MTKIFILASNTLFYLFLGGFKYRLRPATWKNFQPFNNAIVQNSIILQKETQG